MSERRIVVLGAGGFAREVKWLVEEIDRAASPDMRYHFVGFVVSDFARIGPHDSREQIAGDLEWLRNNSGQVDVIAIGVGTPAVRLRFAEELLPTFPLDRWPALVHPSVQYDRDNCRVGPGAVICGGVLGTVNLDIGDFSVVNLGCTLGHECRVGPGSVLNPTVNVSGGVDIGAGCLIGTGAQILQYLHIGEGATIGAGSVVTKNVPPGETWAGVPAKPLAKRPS